jgi:hypothetical protein
MKALIFKSIVLLFLCSNLGYTQIANYVTNGGFEEHHPCVWGYSIRTAVGWRTLDSIGNGIKLYHTCYANMPNDNSGARYQWPYKGFGFGSTAFLCLPPCPNNPNRGYFRNRLKGNLESGKTYCVKFYYNQVNNSTLGINSFGTYFGDDNLDTITKGFVRVTYLTPQVKIPSNIFSIDTLGWSLCTGTFVANGNEKHIVIGNFSTDIQTGTVSVNPTFTLYNFSDLNIDHVSCIDIDLPAFAGHDTTCIPGTTIYLGRQRDVGIDEACMWYKLPITITPTTPAIDTAAGIWVSPTQTSTYVVRQEICGNVKWDTVIVYKDAVGFGELLVKNEELKIFPVPANQSIELQVSNIHLFSDFTSVSIYNSLGQVIRVEDILFKTEKTLISTSSLPNGVYSLCLKNAKQETLSKKFVVYR